MGVKLFGLDIQTKKERQKAAADMQAQLVAQTVQSQIGNFLTAYSRYFTTTPESIKDGVTAYATVTDVYAIIQYIASKFSTVPVSVYRIKDKKALKNYRYFIQNKQIKEASKWQLKAMDEELTENPISRILQRPNLQQAQDSFLQQAMGFRLSGGAAPIWMNKGQGKEPVALHCLLPSKLEFKPTANNPFYREKFQFDEIGIDLEGDIKDLIYWPYWSPEFDSSTFQHLYGFSPLRAAAYTMSANQEAQKAALSIFKNKGVHHIVYPNFENQVIPQPQRDKMREDMSRYVNNPDNRGGIFLSGAPLGSIDMGSTSEEMDIIKSMNLTRDQLCNVYQFPPVIFDPKSTFANLTTAGKQLVTNKIIPEWTSFAGELNSCLVPAFQGTGGYIIEPDFSMLYEMQEDVKIMSDTLMPLVDSGTITRNDLREELGWDRTTIPEHDLYIVKGDYQTIQDAAAPVEVEEIPNNSLLDDE